MRERKTITKEELQALRITNVTETGVIYYKGKIARQFDAVCKHKYGKDKKYPVIAIYDPAIHKEYFNKNKNRASGTRIFLVSRVVYAWFHGLCPGDYDVDHIDNDPYNNSVDNLQLLTRKENLAKRAVVTKYTQNMSESEIRYFNNQVMHYKNMISKVRTQIHLLVVEKHEYIDELKNLAQLCKDPNKYVECIEQKNILEAKIKDINEQIAGYKSDWHFWCKALNDFKDNYLNK